MTGSETDRERGFLTRWSRRKQAAHHGPVEEAPAPVETAAAPAAEAPGQADGQADAQRSDAEILAEHGLPDPDALQPGDDIRGFMARSVPARLRNRALRKLWVGNPVLANVDGLVDYGEDFTDAAKVVENLVTTWQVGRGYRVDPPAAGAEDAMEAAPGETPDEAPATSETAGETAPETVDTAEGGDATAEAEAAGAPEALPADAAQAADTATAEAGETITAKPAARAPAEPVRQRMRFT